MRTRKPVLRLRASARPTLFQGCGSLSGLPTPPIISDTVGLDHYVRADWGYQDQSMQTLASSSGHNVVALKDFSAGENHFDETIPAGKEPTYEPNVFNTHPAIVFDGANDYLRSVFGADQGSPQHYFITFSLQGTNIGQTLFDDSNNLNNNRVYGQSGGSTNTDLSMYVTGGLALPETVSNDITTTCEFLFNGASSKCRINGSDYAAGDVGDIADLLQGITLGSQGGGGSTHMQMKFAEFRRFNVVKSDSEADDIMCEMIQRYNAIVPVSSISPVQTNLLAEWRNASGSILNDEWCRIIALDGKDVSCWRDAKNDKEAKQLVFSQKPSYDETDTAVFFSGTDENLVVEDAADLDFGDGVNDEPFSVSARFKTTQPSSVHMMTLSRDNIADNSYSVWCSVPGGTVDRIRFIIRDSGGTVTLQCDSSVLAVNDDAFHTVTYTYDGSGDETGLEVYLDGVNVVSSRQELGGTYSATESGTQRLRIGGLKSGSNVVNEFTGEISGVQVHEAVLTAQNALDIHCGYVQDEIPENSTTSDSPSAANVVAHWRATSGEVYSGPCCRVTANDAEAVYCWWDISGNHHEAKQPTLGSRPDYSASDNSLAFDGATAFLEVDDHDDFTFSNGSNDLPFSVAVNWSSNNTASPQGIAGKADHFQDENSEWYLIYISGQIYFRITDQLNSAYIGKRIAITLDGTYRSITVTYDGSGLESGINIYFDGVLQSAVSASGGIGFSRMRNSDSKFYIGRREASGAFLTGNLKDVQVLNKELTLAEVQAISDYHNPGYPVSDYVFLMDDESENVFSDTGCSTEITDLGAVACWHDVSVNGFEATQMVMANRPQWDDDGPWIEFDAVTDVLEIADDDLLSFGDGATDDPFSIAGWVYPGSAYMVDKAINTVAGEWFVYFHAGEVFFGVIDRSTGARVSIKSASATTATWAHYTFTYNGNGAESGLNIYRDGSLLTPTGNSGGSYVAMENGVEPVNFGRTLNAGANLQRLHLVALFDRVLTGTEITNLAAYGDPS